METFTLMVFSENRSGILARIVGLITRRKINIESLTVSQSSLESIHRFTIVVDTDGEVIRKLTAQINKQVEVLRAFYYSDDEIVFQEIALYKVQSAIMDNSQALEQIIRKHNARILRVESEYSVIEKTGHAWETEALLAELKELGLYEFVRSGRVAVARPMERLNKYLNSLQQIEEEIKSI